MSTEPTELHRVEELFAFLQGTQPEGYRVSTDEMPRLGPDQAWTVIWYLGNQYWQVPDHIERCDVCGCLYDTCSEGACLDWGNAPYNFCGCCDNGEDFAAKARTLPTELVAEYAHLATSDS